MKKGVTAFAQWKELSNSSVLNEDDSALLCTTCFQVLKDPIPPSPKLRREARAFSTVLQDFLAYSELDDSSDQTLSDDPALQVIFASLEASEFELRGELDSAFDLELLAVARWNAVRSENSGNCKSTVSTAANSLTSSDVSGTSQLECGGEGGIFVTVSGQKMRKARNRLLRMYYALKKMFSFHCQVQLRRLQEIEEGLNLLSEYVMLWNAYSASAVALNDLFSKYSDLMTRLCDEKWMCLQPGPTFNVVRMMTLMWRRKVFAVLKDPLLDALSTLITNQRKSIFTNTMTSSTGKPGKKPVFDDPESLVLMRYFSFSSMQAILDLSIHELNIHFLDHSLFQTDGPYNLVHNLVVSGSHELVKYIGENLPMGNKAFSADLKFVKRCFLTCTSQAVEQIYAQAEKTLWERHFRERYFTAWPRVTSRLDDIVAQQILASPFGLMVFQLDSVHGSRAQVQAFIEYLLAEDAQNKDRIQRCNDLVFPIQLEVLASDSQVQDEEIEFQARKCFRLSEDMLGSCHLFSLAHDLSVEDLGNLLGLREDMQVCE